MANGGVQYSYATLCTRENIVLSFLLIVGKLPRESENEKRLGIQTIEFLVQYLDVLIEEFLEV